MSQLIPLEQKMVNFHGAEILGVMANDSRVYIGVSYICNGIGLSENQKDVQVQKVQNDIVLNTGAKKLPLKFQGQVREVLVIDLKLLPLWLAKITITPSMQENTPEIATKLVEYQLKAADVLAEAFLNKNEEKKPSTYRPWAKKAEQHFKFAKLLTDTTGVKPGIAYALAMDEAEKETGRSLAMYKQLLPAAEHDVGYLTPRDIAEKTGLKSAIAVNKKLEELGLQRNELLTRKSTKTGEDKTEKVWRLTDAGMKYGEELPFVRNGHSGYQIKWSSKIIEVLTQQNAG